MNKNNKNEKKSFGDISILIFRIVSIIIIAICLVILYRWHQNNVENDAIIDELGEFSTLEDSTSNTDEQPAEVSTNE